MGRTRKKKAHRAIAVLAVVKVSLSRYSIITNTYTFGPALSETAAAAGAGTAADLYHGKDMPTMSIWCGCDEKRL
jgi:hypothetical protein